MSRISIPISGKTLWSTADVKLRVYIDLLLRGAAGQFVPERFQVDSATDLTTFSAYDAKRLGLPIPSRPSPGATHTQTGREIRSGLLRFQVAGMDSTEYVVPCFFLGAPDTPPAPPAPVAKPLLQPLALLGQLTFTMQKGANCPFLHGELIVEKQ